LKKKKKDGNVKIKTWTLVSAKTKLSRAIVCNKSIRNREIIWRCL